MPDWLRLYLQLILDSLVLRQMGIHCKFSFHFSIAELQTGLLTRDGLKYESKTLFNCYSDFFVLFCTCLFWAVFLRSHFICIDC